MVIMPDYLDTRSRDRIKAYCKVGRLFDAERLLNEYGTARLRKTRKWTPLFTAVDRGFHSLVELLLRYEHAQWDLEKAYEGEQRRRRSDLATMIIEHLAYDPLDERYDSTIFAVEKAKEDFTKAFRAKNHIYDYVFTDSKGEREFVEELDTSAEVTVYAKLPRGFAIPTPVGDYNPDWAIVFNSGKVRHVYFIAETKGSMSKLDLRPIEESKISCARKFFARISDDQVKYDMVDSYEKLMSLVR